MSDNPILVEQDGPVRRLWLNRPQARNAQSRQLLDELDDALQAAQDDTQTLVVVLAAKGPHFSAGHDLKQAQAERASFTVEERWAFEARRYYGYCLRIWDFPKPTVAQVQGACISGGFMLANMCDLIIASDDAFFSDPVTHTLGAAATEVLIHPWVMGLRRAKEMLFLGERVTAAQAEAMGMVNRVVPSQRLDDESMALAQRIAQAPPFSMQLLKRSMNRSWEAAGMRTALSAHFDLHQLSHETEEHKKVRRDGLAQGIARAAQKSGQP